MTFFQMTCSILTALSLASVSGIRAFLPLAVLGLSARLGWIHLQPDFGWLKGGLLLVLLGFAALGELTVWFVEDWRKVLGILMSPLCLAAASLTATALMPVNPVSLRWAIGAVSAGAMAAVFRLSILIPALNPLRNRGKGTVPILTLWAVLWIPLSIYVPVIPGILSLCAASWQGGRLIRWYYGLSRI